MKRSFAPRSRGGFTLIELLTVIAIIGVLAAVLIPTVSSVRTSANKAKTKTQFSQWAAAIESFRSEYGYYPAFDASGLVNPSGQSSAPAVLHLFHDVLAGHRRDGSALPSYAATSVKPAPPEVQNRKLVSFYSFTESDFTDAASSSPNLIRDAFENTAIAVLVDKNLDGVITVGSGGDYTSLPSVAGLQPTTGSASADFPLTGVRAGVVFYAPAPDATVAAPSFIFSWK